MNDSGSMEQLRTLQALRKSRASAFRKEIVPHFRYVFQSGFGLFVSALLFAALIWYVDFIKAIPQDWPADVIGVAVLTIAAAQAPLRTYFRSADEVFLLPLEGRMLRGYIHPALRQSIGIAIIRTLLVFAVYSPIYSRSELTGSYAEERPLLLLAFLLAFLAGGNVYGGWRERQPAATSWRVMLKGVRWLLTALVITAFLLKPIILACVFLLIVALLMSLLWRIPAQHAVPWERLIAEEAGKRRRWLSFLGWFVDVPSEVSKPAQRRWISWLGDRYLWKHDRSWHFLYAKAFLRGEIFAAFSRWLGLASLLILITGHAMAAAVVYGVAILVTGLQLSELKRVKFIETETQPIAPEGRLVAAASIGRMAGLVAVCVLSLMGIMALFTFNGNGEILNLWLPLLAAGLIWCVWWMPRKMLKFKEEEEI